MNLKDEFNGLVKTIEDKKLTDDKTLEIIKKGSSAIASIKQTKQVVGLHMGMGMNIPEGTPYKEDKKLLSSCIKKLKVIIDSNMKKG